MIAPGASVTLGGGVGGGGEAGSALDPDGADGLVAIDPLGDPDTLGALVPGEPDADGVALDPGTDPGRTTRTMTMTTRAMAPASSAS